MRISVKKNRLTENNQETYSLKVIKRFSVMLIFITYFFVFGQQLPYEITYIPLWVEDLKMADVVVGNSEQSPESFRLNGKYGYLCNNGEITYMEDLLYGVAIDGNGFISYSRQNDVLVIRDIDGRFLNTIELTGYPFFSGDRRFVISYDKNQVSEINNIGTVVWQKTFSSSITEVSATPSLVFIGNVDGKFSLIDSMGEVAFSYTAKTSRINAVYGGSVSENGDYILTVSGIDPQLISLWSKNSDGYRVDASWSIDKELRRHAVTGFSEDGLFAFIEAEDELFILEIRKAKLNSVKITGRLQSINFPGSGEIVHVTGRDEDGLYLIAIETSGNQLFYTRLAGTNSMFIRDQNKIILGIDNKLIGFDMESM